MAFSGLRPVDITKPEWKRRLEAIVARLVEAEPNVRVLVFGSFALNRMTEDSDLDLAVILPDAWTPSEFERRILDGGPLSDWPYDLIVVPRSRFERMKDVGGVCFDIDKDGIELHPNWTWT